MINAISKRTFFSKFKYLFAIADPKGPTSKKCYKRLAYKSIHFLSFAGVKNKKDQGST